MRCESSVCLSVLLCLFLSAMAVALNSGDEGVCDVVVSSRVTKSKTVFMVVTRWCGKRKCSVKKPKRKNIVQTISKKHTVCCKGYHYDSENGVCSPSCSTGCVGGKCIAPDICHCEPPAILDPEHKNACISPICEPSCMNAQCVFNNTCQCNQDFTAYNATHCIPNCVNGFEFDINFTCVPKCKPECINSDCVEPNKCKCHDGYALSKDNDNVCEPTCACLNGICDQPNKCSCFEGYVKASEMNCIPKCEGCDYGNCTAPNNCTCFAGFTKVDGVCKPVCEDRCVNSVCSAPNLCSCNEGYIRNESSPHICYKPCEYCEGSCTKHGECINAEPCVTDKM